MGLSMRDYIERHFADPAPEARRLVQRSLQRLERAFRRYREAGAVELDLVLSGARSRAADLSLTLRGHLDRGFFSSAARHLERLLRQTRSSVTLRIEALQEAHLPHLDRLLQRLARHGDRIRISVPDRLREVVRVDSSVFVLSFEG